MNNHVPKVDNLARVGELESRVSKLEQLVQGQSTTIDELKKLLCAESDKVKVLKVELEKYAQKYYVQV